MATMKATTAPSASTEAAASSTSAMVASWVAVAMATVLVALAVMKFKRTKGRIWKFHAAYAVVVALLVFILPHQIKEDIFSVPGVVVAGMIFPVYQSLRALVTPSTVDDMEWLQYWCAASGIYVLTAFLDDYQLASASVRLAWYQFEFFFFIWLYLPFTDGSTLIFDFITRPILSPIIDPLSKKMNNWINTAIMTVVNASHLWFLWAFFMILPKDLKRFVTIAVGTVFPLMASITAISTPDKTDDTFWLTYWSCYGLLFVLMDWLETYIGKIWGFYSLVIFSTVYLMLPMFQGSEKLFRNVLVPLAGLKESLLLRDAVMLKKQILDSLPADRQAEVRKLITYSFDIETPDDEDDQDANDPRLSINHENAKAVLSWATSAWNPKIYKRKQGGTPNERTSLVQDVETPKEYPY